MSKNTIGFTDEAAVTDLFDIDQYISGLTEFITRCRTPMTISIQGTWGTGKTTMMNIINDKLNENPGIQTIWFNTWQFSQFKMDDDLAISFLEYLCDEMDLSEENRQEMSRLSAGLRRVGAASKEVLLSVVDSQLGGRIADNLEHGLNGNNKEEKPLDIIRNLRERFAAYIADMLERKKKEKIIIFVDDLDRLEPKRAVDLLEVLKLFLDSPSCVFVLAIDYDVVIKGVEAKYDFDDPSKGKSFFDKIIQVPFRIPIANYNISKYVGSCLNEIGIDCDEKEIALYENLIIQSIGANPRAIKRLFNSYLLIQYMTPITIWSKAHSRQLLFAILCLQASNENLYDIIAENLDTVTMTDLHSLLSEEKGSEIFEDLNREEISEWTRFLQLFIDLVKSGAESDDKQIDRLRETMALSAITSAAGDTRKKRRGTAQLDHDYKATKVLNATDIKYNICQLGTAFHIGFNQPVQVEYEGHSYPAKMHKSAKGRIDRMAKCYKENDFKEGDCFQVSYEYDENRLIFQRINVDTV